MTSIWQKDVFWCYLQEGFYRSDEGRSQTRTDWEHCNRRQKLVKTIRELQTRLFQECKWKELLPARGDQHHFLGDVSIGFYMMGKIWVLYKQEIKDVSGRRTV